MFRGIVVEQAVVIVVEALPLFDVSYRDQERPRFPIHVVTNASHVHLLTTASARPSPILGELVSTLFAVVTV